MNEVSLEYLATVGGLSVFIMLLIGLLVKPAIRAAKGEEWEWAGPVVNAAAFAIGVVTGVVVGGLLSGWVAETLFLGGVTGVFAAATAVGLYEAARSRLPV